MRMSGHLDLCGPALIEGWLYADIGRAFSLQVYVDDRLVGECTADRFRPDLQAAGYGDGRYGFSFELPADVAVGGYTTAKLRIVDSPVYLLPDDHTVLPPVYPDHALVAD